MISIRLEALWRDLVGKPTVVPPHEVAPVLSTDDPFDMSDAGTIDDRGHLAPDWVGQAITGRRFRIQYRDSKGQCSERTVVCRRLEERAGTLYLMAWCSSRERLRVFRVDRIEELIDPETGEVFSPGEPALRLFVAENFVAPYRYGLPPRQFASFNAALNVLVFMACCDGEWHLLEMTALEDFAASWWMRAEIASPFDLSAIEAHARRLSPDPEAMFVSLLQCASDPVMSQIIRRHIAAVIDADGVHHPAEVHWGQAIDDVLRGE